MARPFTTAQRNAIKARGYTIFTRVSVENAAGAYIDFSTLGGFDWFDTAQWTDTVDSPTMEGTVTFIREQGALSLAPLMTGSALNSGAPAIDGGRGLLIFTCTLAPGLLPTSGDWVECFRGVIIQPDCGQRDANTIVCQVRDIGTWLMSLWTPGAVVYSTDAGTSYEAVMQAILDDNINSKLGAVTLYTPVSPGTNLRSFTLDSKPVLQALRDLANEIGWDVKFLYDAAGNFRLTFYQPDRAKTVPDWVMGPDEYFEIPNFAVPTDDVRNIVDVAFTDHASGAVLHSHQTDPTSIAKYGERPIFISEDASSEIDSMTEADAMSSAILTDLKLPYATQGVLTSFFPFVQNGDLGTFGANGVMYDFDINLAVVQIQHSLSQTDGSTTLSCRAQVAGAYKAWLQKENSGPTTIGVTDPELVTLDNFKEIRRDDTSITYGFTPSALVAQIWLYQRVLDQPTVDPPWPEAGDLPTLRFDNTLAEFTIQYPPIGKITYTFFEPRAADMTTGAVKRVTTTPTGEPPHFENETQAIGASGLFANVAFNVIDSQLLGGKLKVWVNPFTTDNADSSMPPDGLVLISATPFTADSTVVFLLTGGGTSTLLGDIPVHPGRGKRIFAEFINSGGTSSGVQSFILLSEGGIIDAAGQLIPGSIANALAFAAAVQPVQVFATVAAFPAAPDGTFAFATSTGKIYRRVSGAWIANVDGADIIAGSIVAGKIAAGAITATAIAAGAVQAIHISVAVLTDISSNLGIILAGKLTSISGAITIDLNATGTSAVLDGGAQFKIRANGNAEFAGTFTGASAVFAGAIITGAEVLAGNGFEVFPSWGIGCPTVSMDITFGASGIFYNANGQIHHFLDDVTLSGALNLPAGTVSVGAAGTGPGGSGKALYVP